MSEEFQTACKLQAAQLEMEYQSPTWYQFEDAINALCRYNDFTRVDVIDEVQAEAIIGFLTKMMNR